jgi:gliding motility-associated-like protein
MKKAIFILVTFLYIVACKKQEVAPKFYDSEITYRSEIVTTRNNVNGVVNWDTVFSIYIPNAFTPNGDGVNDNFKVIATGIKSFMLTIFDRWGASVFSTTNAAKGWNGTITGKGKLENGIYNYQINVTDKTGANYKYFGEVLLVR